ncbi:glutaredoxin family protein [Ferrimonas balearica]|uniref:glutaredoxin family protein n=1 Tax=Ferrimonas balearica TaxID=44012 RepID=UPI001C55C9D8|nr:glutathione S-transferase N-terminal domain-containing protein [Ferrimonas balearica]MBW3140435.1 glutathione S-transferase N-terminal domain-containing protein [Ferrimonas balearica]MBW3165572.1 glutathione S-transferase N-terminal domain-containing protein [Ferrimonas balearica]MBY5981204.1 glutathione S-transferase N-terminal domain-containing protein [Ferrimonas balearica]MBY6107750.1 glutathione S-transferase N-terminal domain-containing protein [Ferrimonas balearica]MBY6225757.1 gluta
MFVIRWILGRIVLLVNALTAPKPAQRPAEQQAKLDQAMARYSLYQYDACPFCVKVRRALRRNNFNIELRDAKQEPHRSELEAGGGRLMVPCLRIEEAGEVRWMYESSDIIAYLEQQYGDQPQTA